MVRGDRMLLFGLAALTLTLAVLTLVVGVQEDVLLAATVLVLALLLVCGRHVGEESLARLAAVHDASRRHRRPVARLAPTVGRAPRITPRGGCLIAAALAVRPPPPARPLPAS